jgi:hypothetical protein
LFAILNENTFPFMKKLELGMKMNYHPWINKKNIERKNKLR